MGKRSSSFASVLCALVLIWLNIAPAMAVTGLPVPAVYTPSDMVLKVTTTQPNTVVEMPLNGTVSNVDINWGDGEGTGPFNSAGNRSHTYASAGDFTIVISGSMTWLALTTRIRAQTQ